MADDHKGNLDHIEVRSPDGGLRIVPVHGARLVIGRAPQCEICVDFDQISRQHAELIRDPFGRWWARDLGSRNGFKVNGKRVAEAAVSVGDVIRVGKFDLRLASGNKEEETSALATNEAAGEFTVQTLDENHSPAITGKHLESLLNFAKRLANSADAQARRRALCELMADEEFGALAAMIIRWPEGEKEPQLLCQPSRSGKGDKPYHVSRTLLAAMRSLARPVMGSNTVTGGDLMKLSLDNKVMSIGGIACPMDSDEGLYVAITPEYARSE